ncbi:MAG: FtsX-like permease family protein [Christensenellaceae bacterium]|nr:FtsX-like permease family protein [Christensenellaceae bacterium]
MRKPSAWSKNNRREIFHTLGRYCAILIIITLGVGFFSGLSVTKEAMLLTANEYVNDESNMYDFRLFTSIGFTSDDEKFYRSLEGIDSAEGAYSIDFFAEAEYEAAFAASGSAEGRITTLKAISITERINKARLLYGRMPVSPNECIADASVFGRYSIGTTISISDTNIQSTVDFLKYSEYTIVGIGCSTSYLNRDRGTTTLEGGSLDGFVLIPKAGFNSECYTEMLLTLNDHAEVFSDEYYSSVEMYRAMVEASVEEHSKQRFEDLKLEAYTELENAMAEFESQFGEYLEQRASAEQELDAVLSELNQSKFEIDSAQLELDNAKQQIAEGRDEYYCGLDAYDAKVIEFEKQRETILAAIEQAQDEIDSNRAVVDAALAVIEATDAVARYQSMLDRISELQTLIDAIEDQNSPEYIRLTLELEYLQNQIDTLLNSGAIDRYHELLGAASEIDSAQAELDERRSLAETQLAKAQSELQSVKKQLDDARHQLDDAELAYTEGILQLYEAKRLYDEGLAEYEKAKAETDARFAEADVEFNEASEEIANGEAAYNSLVSSKLISFVLGRSENSSYVGYENDASIMEGLSKVLPVFFFFVAALVCTTTMMRMVDEQRTQIGTLKALGYSNRMITMKYISYSGSAALIGCILGYFFGSWLFPFSTWQAYKMLYNFGEITIVFDALYFFISLAVSMICTVGSTFLACYSELTLMPAALMRPKAPNPGKRVFLERIHFLWNHLSFFAKVSIRNILRYKRRLIMMLLGVGGCTALVLTCLGVKDSIANIAEDQFGNIMKYDYSILFAEAKSDAEMQEFNDATQDILSECVFVLTDSVEVETGGTTKTANIVAANDPAITNVIGLSLNGVSVAYPSGNNIIVNEKLAKSAGIGVGDTITVRLSETESVELTVEGIFENYVYNYIYMTEEAYVDLLEREISYNTAFAVCAEELDVYEVSASLLNDHGATSVTVSEDIERIVGDMMSSLNYIIGLVIACACALALVVAYNIGNIAITERVREIATLKVLGFHRFETSIYVFRENLVLTVIGSILGLPFGVILHSFVMNQVSIEMVSFNVRVSPFSFVCALAISIVLALMVDVVLQRKIDKINMAESLKSVE